MNHQLLFVPGMCCSHHIWESLENIKEKYSCSFIDWDEEETPHFKTIDDCARWVGQIVNEKKADVVIGHSLGGLALLKAKELGYINPKFLITIESFLKTPPDFFRKFVGPLAPKELEENLHEMFNYNRQFFSEDLRETLKNEGTHAFVNISQIKDAYFFYAMRGVEDAQKVLQQIPLLDQLDDSNSIMLLPYSGHFPMIEEPQELEECIEEIIK